MKLSWVFKKFESLTTAELYAIMQLRNEVFVVEQKCVYQDADNKDQRSLHLCGWDGETLVAYTRIIPPDIPFKTARIGRVVTAPLYRKTGTGKLLMEVSISKAYSEFNCSGIKVSAQVYLIKFYESFGFNRSSEAYLEDGIPHIEMTLKK